MMEFSIQRLIFTYSSLMFIYIHGHSQLLYWIGLRVIVSAMLLFRWCCCVSFHLCCCVIEHTAALSFLRPHSMQQNTQQHGIRSLWIDLESILVIFLLKLILYSTQSLSLRKIITNTYNRVHLFDCLKSFLQHFFLNLL